ncbi:MAG: heme-binding protein [Flavonifractor plautii]
MAQRAVERAGQLGVPVVFSAVDSGGNLVLLQRMEGAAAGRRGRLGRKGLYRQRLPDADP